MASIDTFSGNHTVNLGAITGPATRTGQENDANVVVPESDTTAANPLGGSSRLFQLLTRLEKMLRERYAFDVFAKNSINFGILVTYRQTWVPENYQVGDLVTTIPLAPKEIRRYTTRKVTKKTRATKELEDQLQTRRTESSETSRVESEIVEKAQEKTNFNVTAKESIGGEGRLASGIDAELRRRAGQAIREHEAGDSRERAEERAGVSASSTRSRSTRASRRSSRRRRTTRSRTPTTSWRSRTCSTSCSARTRSASGSRS